MILRGDLVIATADSSCEAPALEDGDRVTQRTQDAGAGVEAVEL
ncbi:hypothetical protein ACFYRY_22425 [Streptomyces sp. NPDC005263]